MYCPHFKVNGCNCWPICEMERRAVAVAEPIGEAKEPVMAYCSNCERCVEADTITKRRIPGGDEVLTLCWDCK